MNTLKNLSDSIAYTIDWLETWDIDIPVSIINDALNLGVKTYDFYLRTITRLVRNLYNGYTTEAEFTSVLENLITGQFTRAWYEGMAQNDWKPADMTDEWQVELDSLIQYEYQFIADFAKAITDAKKNEQPLDGLLSRAELWANRYNEIVSHAVLFTADKKERLVWKLGATEQHCDTCSRLDGIVAYAEEWQQLGIQPQSAPNDKLECGGWKCDCSLTPTDKRRSPKAFDTILNIVTK